MLHLGKQYEGFKLATAYWNTNLCGHSAVLKTGYIPLVLPLLTLAAPADETLCSTCRFVGRIAVIQGLVEGRGHYDAG